MDASLFISSEVESRTVELGDGSKHVLHFKQLSAADLDRYFIWATSDNEDVQVDAIARLLSKGLCDADGKACLPLERAQALKRPVRDRLMFELLDVNGYGKAKKDAPGKT